METLSLFLGICIVLPVALLVSGTLVALRAKGVVSKRTLVTVLLVIWIPVLLASVSELWWMFVDEPHRVAAGQPIQ